MPCDGNEVRATNDAVMFPSTKVSGTRTEI